MGLTSSYIFSNETIPSLSEEQTRVVQTWINESADKEDNDSESSSSGFEDVQNLEDLAIAENQIIETSLIGKLRSESGLSQNQISKPVTSQECYRTLAAASIKGRKKTTNRKYYRKRSKKTSGKRIELLEFIQACLDNNDTCVVYTRKEERQFKVKNYDRLYNKWKSIQNNKNMKKESLGSALKYHCTVTKNLCLIDARNDEYRIL